VGKNGSCCDEDGDIRADSRAAMRRASEVLGSEACSASRLSAIARACRLRSIGASTVPGAGADAVGCRLRGAGASPEPASKSARWLGRRGEAWCAAGDSTEGQAKTLLPKDSPSVSRSMTRSLSRLAASAGWVPVSYSSKARVRGTEDQRKRDNRNTISSETSCVD
jgi:hypothetical protein